MNPPVPVKTSNDDKTSNDGKTSNDDKALIDDKNQPKDKSHIKRVRCEFCDKLFNVRYMVRHMRVHTGEKPYNCAVCGKSFTVHVNLITHMRKHTGERPFHCKFCEKSFTTNGNLATHMRLHTGERPYKCEVCGNVFNTNSNLDTHMRTHTGERPYECEICSKAFSHRSHLVKHMKTHIREYMGNISQTQDGNSEKSIESHTNDVILKKVLKKCVDCEKLYVSDKGLARHRCKKRASSIYKLCKQTLETAESLDGHTHTEHASCNSTCSYKLCGQTLKSDKSLDSHSCNENVTSQNKPLAEPTKSLNTVFSPYNSPLNSDSLFSTTLASVP